jgi:hypothetical protein
VEFSKVEGAALRELEKVRRALLAQARKSKRK